MRWKTYEEQLIEDARQSREMTAEMRLRALFSMIGFVARLSADTGTWGRKLAVHQADEEEGRRRLREWTRRDRA